MSGKQTKAQLRLENDALRMQNSFGDLIQSANQQANITSFMPIIQHNIYAPLTLNPSLLTWMYKTHGVVQAFIDMPVQDALRGGVEIQSTEELDSDNIVDILEEMEETDSLAKLEEADEWARLYGGAALIINVDQNPEKPLTQMKFNDLDFYPTNRWELLSPGGWKPGEKAPWNPQDKGAPYDSEFFIFYGQKIHRSRVIPLQGKAAPWQVRWQLGGWGMSEVEKIVEPINKFFRTDDVLYELLREAKVDVFKFQNFKNMLLTSGSAVQDRIQKTQTYKSTQNAIVMDKEDEYDQKQLQFSSIADVKRENRIDLACALRIPLTKLFGLSASGFNSGEDDIENYNAFVESEVRRRLRKPIRQILNLTCLKLFGNTYDIQFEFKPLRVMSSIDEENVKTSKYNRFQALFDRGLITAEEFGQLLEKEKLVSIPTQAAEGTLPDLPERPEGGPESEGESNVGRKEGK